MRSYNMRMPEEQNRVLTDHISKWLFCPTQTAVENLKKEGVTQNVSMTGDVMLDSVLHFREVAKANPSKMAIFQKLGMTPKQYRLATLHRAETTEGGLPAILKIFKAFEQLPEKVVLPIHPRTRSLAEQAIQEGGFQNIQLIDPVGYLEMLLLTDSASQVLTDSGGLRKRSLVCGGSMHHPAERNRVQVKPLEGIGTCGRIWKPQIFWKKRSIRCRIRKLVPLCRLETGRHRKKSQRS